MKPKYYVCDRKKCSHCVKGCKYTRDIAHAVNHGEGIFISYRTGLFELYEEKETSIQTEEEDDSADRP